VYQVNETTREAKAESNDGNVTSKCAATTEAKCELWRTSDFILVITHGVRNAQTLNSQED
jgi:hypothetical protein